MSSLLAFFIILLSYICLSEHPFLYDIIGGFSQQLLLWLLYYVITKGKWYSIVCFSLLKEARLKTNL